MEQSTKRPDDCASSAGPVVMAGDFEDGRWEAKPVDGSEPPTWLLLVRGLGRLRIAVIGGADADETRVLHHVDSWMRAHRADAG
jgi:hypothetical protein